MQVLPLCNEFGALPGDWECCISECVVLSDGGDQGCRAAADEVLPSSGLADDMARCML